ncbi:MAG: NADH:ubiquinone reductase (Na(+)-transporting) subunit C, partial [Pseudomonadales bacterium]|nr:NADH:ubiquinone reductase (Na(+)-transporting) subunit C [Pseudomonadales bacterium]
DPARSTRLDSDADLAKISRRENQALVYLVESNGSFEKVILPVHGYGLWSTLYGFIALESDLNTVAGLGFYDHAETPGLGGEVDNPRWKAQWPGKKVYKNGDVELGLLKGAVDPSAPNAKYKVDGLSGATLTGRGVTNLIQFWLGENGFRPFLENFKRGEA